MAVSENDDGPPAGSHGSRPGAGPGFEIHELVPITEDDVVRDVLKKPKNAISIQAQRENVREFLAKRLVSLLAGTLAAGFILLATSRWTSILMSDVKSFFELFFTPLVTLVSAATGFYFGSTRSSDSDDDS